jgi:hypothetical protein
VQKVIPRRPLEWSGRKERRGRKGCFDDERAPPLSLSLSSLSPVQPAQKNAPIVGLALVVARHGVLLFSILARPFGGGRGAREAKVFLFGVGTTLLFFFLFVG